MGRSIYPDVAQVVERVVWDHQAEGSSPSVWTMCRYSTADSISAFQAEDEGSIPFTCSKRVLFGLYKCSLMYNTFTSVPK